MSYIMTEVFINITSTLIVYFIIKLIEKNKDKTKLKSPATTGDFFCFACHILY